jgi:hypothetical protein
VIEVEKFTWVGGRIRGEAREVAEEFAWVGEVGGFGRAIFVHEEGIVRSANLRVVGGEVSPGFGVCGEGLMPVEGDMGDEGADATIVEVHGVYVCHCDATDPIDDYVVFVASGGTEGEVAGSGYAEEDGAGIGGRTEC